VNYFKLANAADIIRGAMAGNQARGVQEIGAQMLKPPAAFSRGGRGGPPPFTADEVAVMQRGEAIYKEVCFACHADDGRGTPAAEGGAGAVATMMAPPLANSTRVQAHRDYVVKTLLHGLDGPVDGRTYAGGVMAPMGSNKDEWIAAVASYVRNTFGNAGAFVTPADVARVRTATAGRTTFWKVDELLASLPAPLEVLPTWKATASHNSAAAAGAFSFASWTTGAPQEAGMWFQIELPQAATITELQFASGGGGGGRRGQRGAAGGDGRGGRGAPTPGIQQPNSGTGSTSPAAPVMTPSTGAFGMHPRSFTVEISINGSEWVKVAEARGTPGTTTVTFAPVEARFLKISLAAPGEAAPAWAMQRLRILTSGASGGARYRREFGGHMRGNACAMLRSANRRCAMQSRH
jgi:mono/diheme cytochrome c family protein